ncbi:MAG: poly(A) polymerase [Bdellovibrionales bacterium]|nr:poly(A) polymerase [Bdellovibrionales bacterium]
MNEKIKPQLHRTWIDPHAVGIVRALQKAGHTTYLVGGCVRDLLLGTEPKDFDIASTARPEQIRNLIHRSFVIGKRFRLVLVKRDLQQFEVATFRREQNSSDEKDTSVVGDNLFGSPKEDAHRRDFTINSLFFDPISDRLIDYCQGGMDLQQRIVRMIGDPNLRLLEDPIRILRALRLAHMTGFQLESSLRLAMEKHSYSLPSTALPRRREEFLKLMRLKDPALAFQEAYDLDVLKYISPQLHNVMKQTETSDLFLHHLRHIHDFAVNKQNPVELFGLLVLAYVRAMVQPDAETPLKTSDWQDRLDLNIFMREELGMFKFEQMRVIKAIQMQGILKKVSDFSRRGSKRQLAVIRNESFPLAMTIAQRDYILNSAEVLFWQQVYIQMHPQIEAMDNRSLHRRRRRRKKVVENQLQEAGLVPAKSDTDL